MFHAFELRFVMIFLVMLGQATLSLLTIANIIVAQLSGSFIMLPIFVVATNAPMSLALLVFMVLDSQRKSPLNIQNEIILCATAGGADLISAVAMLFFKMGDAICSPRLSSDIWNTCGASVATVALLWTSTFLLFAYAIGLFYTARRHGRLHPSAEKSVWRQTVKKTAWTRQTYSADSPPGRRLRKKLPLDVESLRRVVKDKDSRPLSRDKGYPSTSSLSSTTPSRPVVRPPGIQPPPTGFAEHMGYFRRDAYGEYVASTPTRSREFLPPNPSRAPPEKLGGGAMFNMNTQQPPRRPSFPDLPNPFPPAPLTGNVGAMPSPKRLATPPTPRSRSSSNSSGGSGSGTDPGFAGIGAGSEPQKQNLNISIPRPLMSPHRASPGPPSARSGRTPMSGVLLGAAHHRPFHTSAPTTPISANPAGVPRMSFQNPRSISSPTLPQFREAGARPGYNSAHQHARSHPSLAATVSTVTAPEAAYGVNPLAPRPRAHSASRESTQPRPAFLQIPQPAMSPSTRQRVSNAAYPLPLPSLSTYPIKSVAMSAGRSVQPVWAQQPGSVPEGTSTPSESTRAPVDSEPPRSRPLSTVSTVSMYSTSSASHGPPPPREPLPAAVLSALSAEGGIQHTVAHRPTSAPLRRLSKSRKDPAPTRVASQHGTITQNRWGGTGNGPARRSLAAQFQQPRVAR
ncbi:hypothetical protein BDV93DRAFT_522943 [Ceratobasidium sp. AG-I]|nr:hypothetical protein BDV93DRAFT_522943 [Ceratobasidium sp. AG-I]